MTSPLETPSHSGSSVPQDSNAAHSLGSSDPTDSPDTLSLPFTPSFDVSDYEAVYDPEGIVDFGFEADLLDGGAASFWTLESPDDWPDPNSISTSTSHGSALDKVPTAITPLDDPSPDAILPPVDELILWHTIPQPNQLSNPSRIELPLNTFDSLQYEYPSQTTGNNITDLFGSSEVNAEGFVTVTNMPKAVSFSVPFFSHLLC